jgi:hypothetical protein
LGEPANRLVGRVGVVLVHVQRVAGVEGVALSVERVARVLDDPERVPREELDVVEARVRLVAVEKDREPSAVRGGVTLLQQEDRVPASDVRVLDAGRARVAGLVEVELLEVRARAEDAVLRPLVLGPPMSSRIQRFPSPSSWMPSYPPRPRAPETSSTTEG